jgi:hypothetical protein
MTALIHTEIVPRTFGRWEVTAEGMRGEFQRGYWYQVPAERLGERWECHLAQKRESVRGPLAVFEQALAYARKVHERPSYGWPCYCGHHRADGRLTVTPGTARGLVAGAGG